MSNYHQHGFGILEAIVASGIIAMVAGGAVMLNSQVIRNTSLLADRLVAFEWAQEGIEIVRQIRDSNLIDGRPETDWKCFNPDINPLPSSTSFDCGFNDTTLNTSKIYHPEPSANKTRWVLKEGQETNQFAAVNGYTREIRVLATTPNDPEKRLIAVTVRFSFGVRAETVTLSTIVSNWRRET